jgi:hypothetical protein
VYLCGEQFIDEARVQHLKYQEQKRLKEEANSEFTGKQIGEFISSF